MSLADIMRFEDPLWDWMHSQEHNNLFYAQVGPFGAQPSTILTPMQDVDTDPASLWQLLHQIVHDNMANYFSLQPSLQMVDQKLSDPWPTFINYTEHLNLSRAASVL